MESKYIATLRQDVIDIMEHEKVPVWKQYKTTGVPCDIYDLHKDTPYGALPDSDKSRDFKTDPVCAFCRKVIDEAFPPEPTDMVSPYDPTYVSNYIMRAATFGMEYTKEREWKNNCSKKDIIKTKYNADLEPWIVQTTHPFDLVYMWFTRHAYRCAENFPEELAGALGASKNLMRRIVAAQVLIHECDREIRNINFQYKC
jgi:hypothetical protein